MARVSTYLNFPGNTEEAFEFYRSVFGGDFDGPILRFGDAPASPGQPPVPESIRRLVMNVRLRLLGEHVLMGTDAHGSMGFTLKTGNHVHIVLEPDTRAEADRLFSGLCAGGTVHSPLQDMFWGAYWGSFVDRFGIGWMINCAAPRD